MNYEDGTMYDFFLNFPLLISFNTLSDSGQVDWLRYKGSEGKMFLCNLAQQMPELFALVICGSSKYPTHHL